MGYVKGIGAHFSFSIMPPGWLPPLDYDWYMLEEPNTPVSICQYLKRNGKGIGLKLYQEIHPFPNIGAIRSQLDVFKPYLNFCTIWEENRTEWIPELNDTYDYIKQNYPGLLVFQWPHTNYFDWNRLKELKCDGYFINPRWWWSMETYLHENIGPGGCVGEEWQAFEGMFLKHVLETGKPFIDGLFVGWAADYPEGGPCAVWKYAIGQFIAVRKVGAPVVFGQAFHPGFPETEARIQEILSYEPIQPPAEKPFNWTWVGIGGAALTALTLIIAKLRKKK